MAAPHARDSRSRSPSGPRTLYVRKTQPWGTQARLHNHSLARALAACSRLKTWSAQSGSSASSTRLRVPSAD